MIHFALIIKHNLNYYPLTKKSGTHAFFKDYINNNADMILKSRLVIFYLYLTLNLFPVGFESNSASLTVYIRLFLNPVNFPFL